MFTAANPMAMAPATSMAMAFRPPSGPVVMANAPGPMNMMAQHQQHRQQQQQHQQQQRQHQHPQQSMGLTGAQQQQQPHPQQLQGQLANGARQHGAGVLAGGPGKVTPLLQNFGPQSGAPFGGGAPVGPGMGGPVPGVAPGLGAPGQGYPTVTTAGANMLQREPPLVLVPSEHRPFKQWMMDQAERYVTKQV